MMTVQEFLQEQRNMAKDRELEGWRMEFDCGFDDGLIAACNTLLARMGDRTDMDDLFDILTSFLMGYDPLDNEKKYDKGFNCGIIAAYNRTNAHIALLEGEAEWL